MFLPWFVHVIFFSVPKLWFVIATYKKARVGTVVARCGRAGWIPTACVKSRGLPRAADSKNCHACRNFSARRVSTAFSVTSQPPSFGSNMLPMDFSANFFFVWVFSFSILVFFYPGNCFWRESIANALATKRQLFVLHIMCTFLFEPHSSQSVYVSRLSDEMRTTIGNWLWVRAQSEHANN